MDNKSKITYNSDEAKNPLISASVLGASHFNIFERSLKVLEDAKEGLDFDFCEQLIRQIIPDIIITNNRDEQLVSVLGNVIPILNVTPTVIVRPYSEFGLADATTRLLSHCSHIFKQQVNLNDSNIPDILNSINSIIGKNSKISTCCAGALLIYLQANTEKTSINNNSSAIVQVLEKLHVLPFMQISSESMQALNIFSNEKHPNMHNSSKGKKEGISLFGLLDNTKTPLGKYTLQMWMLKPLQKVEEIEGRLNNIQLLLESRFTDHKDKYIKNLANIKKISASLERLWMFPSINDLQTIIKFLFACIEIKSVAIEFEDDKIPILHRICDCVDTELLRSIGTQIVNTELDKLNDIYDGLGSFLTTVAQDQSKNLPQNLVNSMTVVYFPQLGYLISLESNNMSEISNLGSLLKDWCHQFSTEERIYYKNSRMYELDEFLGDIHAHIVDREIEITQMLKQDIRHHSDYLIKINKHVAEFDCLLALSTVAKEQNWTKPLIDDSQDIIIRKGKHPLLEILLGDFIANDTNFSNQEKSSLVDTENNAVSLNTNLQIESTGNDDCSCNVMILTGANFSGKSIYGKQIALIVYLSHIGSYVPAQSAKIGITDRIETKIKESDSLVEKKSSFVSDLQQISRAIRNSTSKTLVILDEFGKGTLYQDGLGLFYAVLHYFITQQSKHPKVIAMTHYGEVYDIAQSDNISQRIQWREMCVVENTKKKEKVVYLYKIKHGVALNSYAFACAQLAGVPNKVINLAKKYKESLSESSKFGSNIFN
ncbi:hypothetical protein BB561_000471 [Smittium simulii]|uniref:DNA mismatch repair proteins mutS family domain-containing protein n=1 Tax=Smittium simulii TaxID=133385 RepID=A0A2T9YYX4_9FUNG|nr:hypothetical protein BB561_000471 [Smittium simulii]